MEYNQELINMCKSILNSKELQSKFNDFDNNLEFFSLNNNYDMHSYQVYFKKVLYDLILKKIDEEDYDVSDLIEYSKSLFEREIDNKPYLIEFNIIKEAMNKVNEDICAFYNDDGRIQENRNMLLKKREILFNLSTSYEEYLCTLDYNEKKIKDMFANYNKLMSDNVNLSFEEVEEFAYLYRTKTITDEKHNKKILRYLFKNIIENHYNIDIKVYKDLFYDMCSNLMKDNNVLGNVYYRTFVSEDVLGLSIKIDDAQDAYEILLNIENVTPKNYIYTFETFFHELLHCKQYSGKNYETLTCIKEHFINFVNNEEYKDMNYWNSSIERYAFTNETKLAREFLTYLAPKEKDAINKTLDEMNNYNKQRLNKNPNERIIDQKGRVKNINILFEEKVLRKRKFLRHFLNSSADFSLLLHEYNLNGSKKSIIELLKNRDMYMSSDYDEELLNLYNGILEEDDTLDYLIENIGNVYTINSEYNEETKNIIEYKVTNWYFSVDENRRDQLLASAISRVRNRILKDFRNTNDLKVYLANEKELAIASNELPNILSKIELKNYEIDENRSL